jgi:hypothetical protein
MGEELPSLRWGPVVDYFPAQAGTVRPFDQCTASTYLLYKASYFMRQRLVTRDRLLQDSNGAVMRE